MTKAMLQWVMVSVAVPCIAIAIAVYAWTSMPGSSYTGHAILEPAAVALRDRLEGHVRHLAETIGARHHGRPGSLDRTADFIEDRLAACGLAVRRLGYGPDALAPWYNLEVEIPGTSQAGEIVLLGAHYDTVPNSPGADDNASGVAVLIELACGLRGAALPRTVRLVAFVNEEEPYAETAQMGSVIYAAQSRARGDRIVAMISLEGIGFFSDERGSQRYPEPVRSLYPDTGNFLAFVGNHASRRVVRAAIASFRRHARVPSEGIAIPRRLVYEIGRSDHASFWQEGYRALMVTDTLPFRNPNYHGEDDLPDALQFDRLALVASGLLAMVRELASK